MDSANWSLDGVSLLTNHASFAVYLLQPTKKTELRANFAVYLALC